MLSIAALAEIPTPESAEAFALLPLEEQRAFWEGYFRARPGWPREPSSGATAPRLSPEEAKAAGFAPLEAAPEDDAALEERDRSRTVFSAPLSLPEAETMAKKKAKREVPASVAERREKILALLSAGKTQKEIYTALGLTQSMVSQDVMRLRAEGRVGPPSATKLPSAAKPAAAAAPKKPRKAKRAKKHPPAPTKLSVPFDDRGYGLGRASSTPSTPAVDALKAELERLEWDAQAVRASIAILERRS